MKMRSTTLLLWVLGALPCAAHAQIGYLWDIEELRARADLVVVAEWIATEDTGRQVEHLDLKPWLPMIELRTTFKLLTILKQDRAASLSAVGMAGSALRRETYLTNSAAPPSRGSHDESPVMAW